MTDQATLIASVLVAGDASGELLVLDQPLSLWGGVDAERGVIISERHPQRGVSLTGRIVVMPVVIGSSSSSSVLAEMLRRGTGPAALVLGHPDSILAIGSIVAGRMYQRACPIVVLHPEGMAVLAGARHAHLQGGRIQLSHTAAPGATNP
jgi:predicted aconitase with swiveling domain